MWSLLKPSIVKVPYKGFRLSFLDPRKLKGGTWDGGMFDSLIYSINSEFYFEILTKYWTLNPAKFSLNTITYWETTSTVTLLLLLLRPARKHLLLLLLYCLGKTRSELKFMKCLNSSYHWMTLIMGILEVCLLPR
jgi:hypothetical protein